MTACWVAGSAATASAIERQNPVIAFIHAVDIPPLGSEVPDPEAPAPQPRAQALNGPGLRVHVVFPDVLGENLAASWRAWVAAS